MDISEQQRLVWTQLLSFAQLMTQIATLAMAAHNANPIMVVIAS